MDAYDTCLTIVCPKALEEALVDHLLEHPELVPGFTSQAVEGHGQGVPLHGTGEEVRGRSRRVQIQVVMAGEAAMALIRHLKDRLPNPEVAYWLSPVAQFGRFA
ncbi:MAG: DUF3240 family protein [Betaproteobacteria bacterium]|nr:DUF3240 family protein [Betaproteobacteria bacterium]